MLLLINTLFRTFFLSVIHLNPSASENVYGKLGMPKTVFRSRYQCALSPPYLLHSKYDRLQNHYVGASHTVDPQFDLNSNYFFAALSLVLPWMVTYWCTCIQLCSIPCVWLRKVQFVTWTHKRATSRQQPCLYLCMSPLSHLTECVQ